MRIRQLTKAQENVPSLGDLPYPTYLQFFDDLWKILETRCIAQKVTTNSRIILREFTLAIHHTLPLGIGAR